MLHGSFIVKLKRFQVGVQAHALPKATIEEYTCVNGANTNSSRRTIVPSRINISNCLLPTMEQNGNTRRTIKNQLSEKASAVYSRLTVWENHSYSARNGV
jgi:hypothetical protein